MATFAPYAPTTTITRAMFNFDVVVGATNYTYSGPIRVSVSASFTLDEQAALHFDTEIFTNGAAEVAWAPTTLTHIGQTLDLIQQFVNVDFQWQGDIGTRVGNSVVNPAEVGAADLADINISLITRDDTGWVGRAGGNTDEELGYVGAAGDVFVNEHFLSETTFDIGTPSRTTLMHELLHSLGLSHPHSDYTNGVPEITADYAATRTLGFDKLGFHTATAADMYKEYFSIMSYADNSPSDEPHTPMILDVIALQQAYGEGTGTQTAGDDTISAGNSGYRVYFDKGGVDTIDLSSYKTGVYLHMGVTITGAAHLVGVAMSTEDALRLSDAAGGPQNLRWFYGEYENATGSAAADKLIGNGLANHISGLAGADKIYGGNGNDVLDGGAGADLLAGGAGGDILSGAAGNDALTGGAGSDKLSGGTGKDIFLFDKYSFSGSDQILDFHAVDDTIKIENALFSKLLINGALAADNYRESRTGLAHDGNDFILYNTRSGGLLYDADGNGAGHAIHFATLYDGHGGHPSASQLSPLDFVIV